VSRIPTTEEQNSSEIEPDCESFEFSFVEIERRRYEERIYQQLRTYFQNRRQAVLFYDRAAAFIL
jgi:hypothetical protein